MAASTSSASGDDPDPKNNLIIAHRTRITDSSSFLGTIRYVGPVASASAKNSHEIYVGIEWDDVTRGKHDGSVVGKHGEREGQLVRHFRCVGTEGRGYGRSRRRPAPVYGRDEDSNTNNSATAATATPTPTTTATTAASFLKLSRRGRDWSTGVPLTHALLTSRYVPPTADLVAPANLLPHHALTTRGERKPIEFLGELQIRSRQQPDRLDAASLRSVGISCPPPTKEERLEVTKEFGHLTDVDLSGNLLWRWLDVWDILRCFDNLTKVGLASNRLGNIEMGDDCVEDDDGRMEGIDAATTTAVGRIPAKLGEFVNVTVLNLNGTAIESMQTVIAIGKIMPNLEELCLAHCDLSDLDTFDNRNEGGEMTGGHTGGGSSTYNDAIPDPLPSDIFPRLRFLDLSDCYLTSWSRQVGRFRCLPQLTDLVLNDNPLGSVVPINESEAFPSLTTLQLTNASITSWSSIDALNNLSTSSSSSSSGLEGSRTTNLKSLRFRSNPLTSNLSAAEARSTLIARLPTLEFLNASPIGDKERMDSERRYVGAVARELLMAETELVAATSSSGVASDNAAMEDAKDQRRQAILALHPRFDLLKTKHTDAMAAAHAQRNGTSGTGTAGSLSHDAVNVTIRSMAASSCSQEPLLRRLPGSLAVGRVKVMCSRAFGLDVDLQTLHYRVDGDAFPTELDDDDNTLSYYGVRDGAEILMNEVDMEARKRQEDQQKKVQERKMNEQERVAMALQAAQTKGF